jgi:predicted AlkP superfamily pyrophosphatase or phosphodiesterase
MLRLRRRFPSASLKLLVAAAAALASLGMSCSSEPTGPGSTGAHVVLITLDGLRPDAVTAANAPTLTLLAQQGAVALQAQTVLPTLTLPSHASMVTGLEPSRHHVTWNDDTSGDTTGLNILTIFDLAKQAGYTSAMFAGKSKLRAIVHVGAPTFANVPQTVPVWLADTVAAHVRKYLTVAVVQPKPKVMFIHLADIDLAGHRFGWMSSEYLGAVRHADSVFARIWLDLKAAFGTDLVLIVTADHGGDQFNHVDGTALDRTIPWIAWGKDVSPKVLTVAVRAVDVAPTMLWVLGITLPAGLDGVPVKSAFPTLAP